MVLGAACERCSRLLSYFRAPPHGSPVSNRTSRVTLASHYPSRLQITLRAWRHASSPRHVDEQSRMVGDGGCVVKVCHLFMDRWASFDGRAPRSMESQAQFDLEPEEPLRTKYGPRPWSMSKNSATVQVPVNRVSAVRSNSALAKNARLRFSVLKEAWFTTANLASENSTFVVPANSAHTNPNPKVRKSGAVGKAVLVSMVLAGSIRVARGDSGEGMVNLRQRHSILTW